MKFSTIVFELLIGNEYFPGVKVVKPFFCNVAYEYSESTDEHKLLSIAFLGNTLEYFRNNGNFFSEVNLAILNNIESMKNLVQERKAEMEENWDNYRQPMNY